MNRHAKSPHSTVHLSSNGKISHASLGSPPPPEKMPRHMPMAARSTSLQGLNILI